MPVIEVYDPPMCCPTGICGLNVDPVLVRFAADLKWLQEQKIEVRRYNLSQQPEKFVESLAVKQSMALAVKKIGAEIEVIDIVELVAQTLEL